MRLSQKSLFYLLGVIALNMALQWTLLPILTIVFLFVILLWRGVVALFHLKELTGRYTLPYSILMLVLTAIHIYFWRSQWFSVLLAGITACLLLKPMTQRNGVSLLMVCFGFLLTLFLNAPHQELTTLMAIDLVLVWALLYQIHYPPGSAELLPFLLKNALKMTVFVTLGFYLIITFFPRLSAHFFHHRPMPHSIGFGTVTQMVPGTITQRGRSQLPAFRVRFTGNPPVFSQLYWRGITLSRTTDGMRWYPQSFSHHDAKVIGIPQSPTIRQDILLEPRSGYTLFALDVPFAISTIKGRAPLYPIQNPDQSFSNGFLMTQQVLYNAESHQNTVPLMLTHEERRGNLQTPVLHDARIAALVTHIKQGTTDPRVISGRLLRFFRDEGFQYRLEPKKTSQEGMSAFLFTGREGYCEHYAASFATLMRLAGVPARVVLGYQGGEANEFDGTLIVRDLDAHAWSEIWSEAEHRWLRVDPTSVVAPLRLELGTARYQDRQSYLPGWVHTLRHWNLSLDALATGWDFYRLGAPTLLPKHPGKYGQAWLLLFLGILLVAVPLALWLRMLERQAHPLDDVPGELYRRYCIHMKRLGITRHPSEGPIDFLRRCEEAMPAYCGLSREFTRQYTELRYAPPQDSARKVRALKSLLKGIRKLSTSGNSAITG